MKKIILFVLLIMAVLMTSCIGVRKNDKILKMGFDRAHIDRVVIVNSRGGVKYTIIDDKSIGRIKNMIIKGKDAAIDSKLEPDFTLEFFDSKKEVASFNYIAGMNDKDTANLVDSNNGLYHISSLIEDEFMKRLMKTNVNKNVPEYYISLIKKMLESAKIQEGSTVVVDLRKDYTVTKYILSIDQKRIIDSIDEKGVNIKLPGEVEKPDYTIKVKTSSYTDTTSKAVVSVIDQNNISTDYYLEGSFNGEAWSYFVKYK